jgi:signal transduction histidine kinase
MRLFFTVTLLLSFLALNGQTATIEFYKKSFLQANTNGQKLDALLGLLEQRESLSTDSLGHYISIAKTLQQSNNNNRAHAQIVIAEAYMNIRLGKLKEAEDAIDAALKKYPVDDAANRDLYFKLYEVKIDCIDYTDNYKKASAIAYKVIKEAESCNNALAIANAYNSLSCWNYDMDFVDKAIQYSYKALSYTTPTPAYYNLLSGIYLNLGESYWWIDKLDSADYYINKGIENAGKAENLNFQYYGLQKMASVKLSEKEFAAAEQYVLRSFEIYKQLDGNVPSNRNLIALGNVYLGWNKPDEAIAFLTDGLIKDSIYNAVHNITADSTDMQRMYVINLLARCYKKKGDYRKYATELEKVISEKDNLYKTNSAHALAELQTKFEVQKKEATIASQQLLLAKRRNVITIISFSILLLLIVGFLYFKNYRKREKLKNFIAVTNAEENERKRIAADLHDNLGVQANAVLYASELLKQEPANNNLVVSNLNDTAKEMLFFLRETLWALKSTDTTAAKLWLRVLNFVAQMRRNYTDINFITSGTGPGNFLLPSAKALNILMIIQEATNNAIKHSNARQITVKDFAGDDNWNICISDNGKGFSQPALNLTEESHGLGNMKQRAKASDIVLNIQSEEGSGTDILLTIPFT